MTFIAALELAKALGKGVWGFLRSIPWPVWLAAAVLVVGWRYGEHRYAAGVVDENARWVAAQVEADRKAKEAADKRAEESKSIATHTTEAAHEATVKTQTETAAAVAKVEYVTRTIKVPADCPVTLPGVVRDEGRAAVERARAARD